MSTITRIRNLYAQLCQDYPEIIEKIQALPPRVKAAKSHPHYALSVLRRKGLSLFAQLADTKEPRTIREIDFDELLELVACEFDEPSLKLSSSFWGLYEEIRQFQPRYNAGRSEISLESKALENLKLAIKDHGAAILPHLSFIQMLIKDLNHYHTLPTAILRRIGGKTLQKGNTRSTAEFVSAITWLKERLGEDYLERIDAAVGKQTREVIIAVENIDSPDLFQ